MADINESLKQFQRACGRYTLITLRAVIKRLPYKVYRGISRGLMLAGQPLLNKKKKLAIKNLSMAFGKEKSEAEIHRIAQACFDNFGQGMIDMIYFADRKQEVIDRVRFEGKEHLDAALKEGKGAVLVGAHFGQFILMYLKFVLAGYKTNVIMRRTRDKAFEEYISNFRNEAGLKTIYDLPAKKCVVDCIRALRNNEILIILLDQNYGSEGRVFVDFFGQKAATATGPVIFSMRTGAPLLPVFNMREEGELKSKVVIEAPLPLITTGNDMENITANVQLITKVIEDKIRQYPHEWGGWMHNRWKTRSLEEQRDIDRLNEENKSKPSPVSQG